MGSRHLPWVVTGAVLAALVCCGGDEAATGPSALDGGPPPDGATSDTSDPSPYGFDTRPSNTTCLAPKRPAARNALGVKLERVYTKVPLDIPVAMVKQRTAPRWTVVQQNGLIVNFDDNANVDAAPIALDLRDKTQIIYSEGGTLGIAFHPKFATSPYAYVYYTPVGGPWDFGVRLSRFRSNDGGATFDVASEKILLNIPRNFVIHHGGNVAFGPDGFLYVAIGDGAVREAAQETNGACDEVICTAFSGKVLRLDVDSGDPYGIPPTNPFANGGGRKEIFAWGFRNPWRWSFDRATGDLWVADVGEESWEEIDRVHLGGNYGWPQKEGLHCNPGADCTGTVDPVFEVAHPEALSITGGYVYRGKKTPALEGAYLFADFVGGKIWALVTNPTTGARSKILLNPDGPPIYASTFAETDDGEVLAVDYQDAADGTGNIYAFVPDGSASPANPIPARLSETGCVDRANPRTLAPGVIPYDIVAPFWSDGAEKQRAFAIPDGTTIGIGDDGDLDLPIGAVTMKTFSRGGRPIETRLFVRHDDGDWGGYTYAWNDDASDALLLADAKTTVAAGQPWAFPSRADCMRCHTTAAGRTLGLELAQLARTADYPGRPARDQLATLAHIGAFARALPSSVTPLPSPTGTAAVEGRARAWLHTNCSNCHRPTGVAGLDIDLRFATPLGATKVCNVVPSRGSMGISDARLLAPGNPERSLLFRRAAAENVWRMPPLGSQRVDTGGTQLLSEWIRAFTGCP